MVGHVPTLIGGKGSSRKGEYYYRDSIRDSFPFTGVISVGRGREPFCFGYCRAITRL